MVKKPEHCPGCGDELPETLRNKQGTQQQAGVRVTSWVLSCPACGAYGIGQREDA